MRYETPSGQSRKLTPKMIAYKANYENPESPTYNNAYQSAIKAGFSPSYAKTITAERQNNHWIKSGDHLRQEMLEKAEQNLHKITQMSDEELKSPQMAKIWQDTNKFISERLGKDYYSTRQELTDKGGRRLFNQKDKDIASIPLSKLFKVSN